MVENRITVVPAGNAVGKSFLGAGLIAWFAIAFAPCKVIVAAPTVDQLANVLWAELTAALTESAWPLGGKLTRLRWDLGENHFVAGMGMGSVESKAGRHAGDLLALVDEASGVDPHVHEALDSLNASRLVYLGNPLRPEGKFFELCEQAGKNPHVNVIRVPSTESPDVDLVRSPCGMADRTFLDDMRHQYGESSLWWQAHILARFPGQVDDGLIPPDWLKYSSTYVHIPEGPARGAIDLAGGNGGDRTVIVVRDDNGILAWDASRAWSLEEAAERCAALSVRTTGARPYRVEPWRWTYDATGIGHDFGARLAAVGLPHAQAYRGALSGGRSFTNLRSAAAWLMRQRFDPFREETTHAGFVYRRPPFCMPQDFLAEARSELLALRYYLAGPDQIGLEPREQLEARLKRSPDFADALLMSFAYPNA